MEKESKIWALTVQSQMRLRLTGSSAEELKRIVGLPEISSAPLKWWANLGDKGQLLSVPLFTEVPEGGSAKLSGRRYATGMILTIRREAANRIALQLPIEAFHLGAVPDVGETVMLFAASGSLEVWKIGSWREEAMMEAASWAASLARGG